VANAPLEAIAEALGARLGSIATRIERELKLSVAALVSEVRAERAEAGVHPEGAVGQGGEVADDLRLGELWKAGRLAAAELLGYLNRREVVARERARPAARLRLLEDQLHPASTSARRSMSAGERFSVTHTSSASSIPE